jgi:acylphosphatase
MEAKKRAHLIVTGRVQGVFFRAETRHAAMGHHLTGWVRNKRDGSVEAIAEGTPDDVQRLIEWCHSGPPLARVDTVDITWLPYTGEFETFEIRH